MYVKFKTAESFNTAWTAADGNFVPCDKMSGELTLKFFYEVIMNNFLESVVRHGITADHYEIY